MPFFRHDGIDFHYEDEGTGLPFVFLHGLGGNVGQPAGLYRPVPGVRFLTMDLRGHGQTRRFGTADRFGFGTFADDVLALLNHLELNKAVVGGISMGAGTALRFALRYPERLRGLVLSRAAWLDGPQPEPNRRMYASIARHIRDWGASAGKEKFAATEPLRTLASLYPDAARSLVKQFDYPYIEETWPVLERIPQDAPNLDMREWERIAVPTLILANRLDPIHPYAFGETLAGRIPRSVFRELTSKSVDPAAHADECRLYLGEYLQGLTGVASDA